MFLKLPDFVRYVANGRYEALPLASALNSADAMTRAGGNGVLVGFGDAVGEGLL
ncbi:MAG: hypothetical protein HY675_22910 [Chloroflexi bacterium]|nr:hypothetical protein [Chloroflexota bacterium]